MCVCDAFVEVCVGTHMHMYVIESVKEREKAREENKKSCIQTGMSKEKK